MNLDITTLYIINALGALFTGLALLLLRRSYPREFQMGGYWATANLAQVAAFFLLGNSGELTFHELAPQAVVEVLAPVLIFWAAILYYLEIKKYTSKTEPEPYAHFWTVIMLIVLSYFSFVAEDASLNGTIVNAGSALFFIGSGSLLLFGKKPKPVTGQRMMGVGFYLAALVYILGVVPVFLDTYPLAETLTPETLNSLVLLTSFFTVSVLSFGYALLINDRLMTDLIRLAQLDPLTEVYNRRAIMSIVEKSYESFKRVETEATLLMIEIDNLKPINNAHGHSAGDNALLEVANLVKGEIRLYDSCGRSGGDEFIVVLPDAEMRIGKRIAERMGDKINKMPLVYGRDEFFLSAFIGVSTFNDTDAHYKNSIDRARRSLENVKSEMGVWKK